MSKGKGIVPRNNKLAERTKAVTRSGRRNELPGGVYVRSTTSTPSRREAANALEGTYEF